MLRENHVVCKLAMSAVENTHSTKLFYFVPVVRKAAIIGKVGLTFPRYENLRFRPPCPLLIQPNSSLNHLNPYPLEMGPVNPYSYPLMNLIAASGVDTGSQQAFSFSKRF